MALTFEQLQQLLKGEKLAFFIAPDRPMVRFGIAGAFGEYDVVVHIQDEGRFLQFRTARYAICAKDHPHIDAVLRLLCSLNYRNRFLKLAWDPSDGEIVAYGDHWVMDSQVTKEQFSRLVHNYLPAMDQSYRRIKGVIETGKDPGEADATALAGGASPDGSPRGGPPGLGELLDRIRKAGDAPAPKSAEPPKGEPIREI